jgi:hypothetical protein
VTGFLVVGLAAPLSLPGEASAVRKPVPVHQFQVARSVDNAVLSGDVQNDCGPPADTPVPDGVPIVVTLPPYTFIVGRIPPTVWRNPPTSDPAWRLGFEGFMYLAPLAVRAYLDGQFASLRRMVDQLVAFHLQNPDPGKSIYGWDEGTAQRRLQAENCLYALTHDTRMRAGMTADANVQLGPRYYGPPYARVHNHGLMANIRIVRAGELLSVPSWRTTGLSRMRTEAPLAFSPSGTTWEQASAYQQFTAHLWSQAADFLDLDEPGSAAAVTIRAVVAKALVVLSWMTEPDGHIVTIGDSPLQDGELRTSTARVFRDDATGWLIGRWSWTDALTSFYSIRYGPVRWAHGHEDRGAITWTTWGARVLIDPGRFDSDAASGWHAWQMSAPAHNAAVLVGARRRSVPVRVTAGTIQAPAHAWQIEDDIYPLHHLRTVNVYRDTHALRVRDSFAGAGPADQYFHLAPSWQLVSVSADRRSAVFGLASGRRLVVTTTGVIAQVIRGSTRPIAGWFFPDEDLRYAAYQLRIRSLTRTTVTVLRVT